MNKKDNNYELKCLETRIKNLEDKFFKLPSFKFYVTDGKETQVNYVSESSNPWTPMGFFDGSMGGLLSKTRVETYETDRVVEIPWDKAIQAILDHLKIELTLESEKTIPSKVGVKKRRDNETT